MQGQDKHLVKIKNASFRCNDKNEIPLCPKLVLNEKNAMKVNEKVLSKMLQEL